MINIQNAAIDIAADMPRRCPSFLATLRAKVDAYIGDRPVTLAERYQIADAVIDLLI